MSNWDKLLSDYGIEYSNEISDIFMYITDLTNEIGDVNPRRKPYAFFYHKLANRYNFQPKQICALIAADRLINLNDGYISKPSLVEEAKCVLDALCEFVSKKVSEEQA